MKQEIDSVQEESYNIEKDKLTHMYYGSKSMV